MNARVWLCSVTLAMTAAFAMAQNTPPPSTPAAPATKTDAPKPAANPESPEVRAQMDALAATMALPVPTRIVFLGDSITAVSRNQPFKYPEMIREHLQAKFGDKVEVINAGVGGDTVGSALKRYQKDVVARQPTLVFINLGINDSKLTAAEKYTTNFYPLDKFIAGYKQLIADMKAGGAEVVALGTIACYDKLTIAAAKMDNPDPAKHKNWFGKPEEVKKYNAAAQALATEAGCGYVDLFDVFTACPDMSKLFDQSDGVHTRDRGQELIALQVMKHLARKYPAPAAK